MSVKLGGSQQANMMAVSTVPSINYTSHAKNSIGVYTLIRMLDNAVDTVTSASFNGKSSYVLAKTTQPDCQGDEAGIGGGIISGTVGKEVKPTSGSGSIFIGGFSLVQEGDTCTMNNKNTVGKYISLESFTASEKEKYQQKLMEDLAASGGGLLSGISPSNQDISDFTGISRDKIDAAGNAAAGFNQMWTFGLSDVLFGAPDPNKASTKVGQVAGMAVGTYTGSSAYSNVKAVQVATATNVASVILSDSQDTTTFYHGTTKENAQKIRENGIDLSKGRPTGDFGQGFYMTKDKAEAIESGRRNAYGKETDAVRFDVPTDKLQQLDTLTFTKPDQEWQDFTRYHKVYSPEVPHGGEPYDMVTGPLVQKVHSDGSVSKWDNRTEQTSIHTDKAAELFNKSIKGK